MAIRTLVTRGFGNGTFDGSIALIVTRGYSIGETPPIWTAATPASTTWAAESEASDTWTPVTPASDTWTPN